MLMGVVELINDRIIHISNNEASAKFFNCGKPSMEGKSAQELGMPEDIEKMWLKNYQMAQAGLTPINFSYWHLVEKEERHLSATVSFIEISENKHPRFSYIVHDNTETKKIQLNLSKQEKFLETVLDNIPAMIFVKEAKNLRFLKFNRAGTELIGLSESELIGKNDYDLFPLSQAEFFISKDRDVFKNKTLLDIPEEFIDTKANGKRILHTKKIPLYDQHGEAQYLVGISEDITEKLQVEEAKQKMYQEQVARQEAEKSLNERDEFISIASHELKSPLSALKLKAQMFRRDINAGKADAYSPERIHRLIEMTEKQMLRLERLVNDMLDVSRIRSGKLSMQLGEFKLHDLVEDVLIGMKEQFDLSQGGAPKFISSSQNVVVSLDYMRIEQVLMNLLTNALRYGKGNPIKVYLSHTKDKIHLSVTDEGIGISPVNIAKIFGRFERAIQRNEVSGLGLGLYIGRQIVESHQGKIWAESKEGKGSSFHVELPLKLSSY